MKVVVPPLDDRHVGVLLEGLAGDEVLGTLIFSIVATGWPAILQTRMVLEVDVDPQHVDAEDPARGNFRALVQEAIVAALPPDARDHERAAADILSNGAQLMLRDRVAANPGLIGETVEIEIPASDPFDQFARGTISRETPESFRRVTDRQIAWWDHLVADLRCAFPRTRRRDGRGSPHHNRVYPSRGRAQPGDGAADPDLHLGRQARSAASWRAPRPASWCCSGSCSS